MMLVFKEALRPYSASSGYTRLRLERRIQCPRRVVLLSLLDGQHSAVQVCLTNNERWDETSE